MPNLRLPINFAVTEWPSSPGSQAFYFNPRNAKQNIGRFLMFVAEHLYEARQPFTSRVPFTIVNAFSALSRVSAGFDKFGPPENFYSNNTPLMLTFALTRDKIPSDTPPNYVMKPYRNMFLWGSSVRDRSKFLTLKVTPEVAADMRFEQFLISNMHYIYFVVGAFTKNLVRKPDWYGASPTFINDGHVGIETLVHSITIPNLFKNFDYTYWAYNAEVWRDASNLLVKEHVTDNLLLYYAAYLWYIKPQFGEVAALLPEALEQFLARGITEVVGALNGGVLRKAGIAFLLYMYRELNGIEPVYLDENVWASGRIMSMNNAINNDNDVRRKAILAILQDKATLIQKLLHTNQSDAGLRMQLGEVLHVFR